ALGFPHGINGTSLAYIQLAGCQHAGLTSDEMEGGPHFQELATLLTAEDYHPGMGIAKAVVRAVCQTALEIGPPGPRQEVTLPNGQTMPGCTPTTLGDYDEALRTNLKKMWGEDFDLEKILEAND
ncbi:hypothetical protein LCGC14_2691630, partial [marine sediment metagenome]